MRHIYIAVFLFVLMLVTSFTDVPYRFIILIVLAVVICINQIFLTKSNIRRIIVGQIIIRKQKKALSFPSITLALIWTLFALTGQHDHIYVALTFWTLVFTEIITDRIYKRVNPISIAINNGELLFNEIRLIRRNIAALTEIKLNGLTDNITFKFYDKSAITIDRNSYLEEDINSLVKYLKNQRREKVTISENLIS